MNTENLAAFENTGRKSHGRPIFRLLRDLHYLPADPSVPFVVAPIGFETDWASVPRFFWRIAAPLDAIEPAVIHDYLCRNRIGTRREADRIFLSAMRDYGVTRWRRVIMWAAVRLYGWTCYPERKDKANGDHDQR